MATNAGLRAHSVQFGNLREATAGEGKGTTVWRGQWNEIGNPAHLYSWKEWGNGGRDRKKATVAKNSTRQPLRASHSVCVGRVISDKNRGGLFFFKFKHFKSNCGKF